MGEATWNYSELIILAPDFFPSWREMGNMQTIAQSSASAGKVSDLHVQEL